MLGFDCKVVKVDKWCGLWLLVVVCYYFDLVCGRGWCMVGGVVGRVSLIEIVWERL